MIGLFLKNEQGKLCYVQPQKTEQPEIELFSYDSETKKITIILVGGKQETLTIALAPAISEGLLNAETILVVDLNDEGTPKREYKVPVTGYSH